jgi:hypothetical protein
MAAMLMHEDSVPNVSFRSNHSICHNPLTPELNPSAQRCLRDFLLGILLLEPCISLIYVCEKPTSTPVILSVY